jgi:hypothetical protein
MIAAHCLLRGFEVGATTVIENSDVGPCAATGAGSAEKTSMNPISAKAAPVAVSSRVEEFNIFSEEEMRFSDYNYCYQNSRNKTYLTIITSRDD